MWDLLLFFLLIVPLVHLIHESGHVAAAKLCSVTNTKIVLGSGKKLWEVTMAGTKIRINIVPFLGGYSTNEAEGKLSHWKVAFISFGGPLSNFASIVIMLPFISQNHFSVLQLFLLFSGWMGLVNLLPFKIGKKTSDGWQIIMSIYHVVKLK